MKHLLPVIMLLCWGGIARSAGEISTVEIIPVSGERVSVPMRNNLQGSTFLRSNQADSPVEFFIYTGSRLIFDEEGNTVADDDYEGNPGKIYFSAPINNISEILFRNNGAEVREISASGLQIDVEDGVITIGEMSSPAVISISTLDGINLFYGQLAEPTTIDLKQFGSGIYLVAIGDSQFKLLVN